MKAPDHRDPGPSAFPGSDLPRMRNRHPASVGRGVRWSPPARTPLPTVRARCDASGHSAERALSDRRARPGGM